jgi:hypothetical protein
MIVSAVYGRDDAVNLKCTLQTLALQVDKIVYVDDCSLDESPDIAKDMGIRVRRLLKRHDSYIGTHLMTKITNICVEECMNSPSDFFIVTPSDVSFYTDYVKRVLRVMKSNQHIVIGSGIILGEKSFKQVPRGAGRIIRTDFWKAVIKRFPLIYGWETYPLLKAQSLGYEAITVPDAKMVTWRPTQSYKRGTGRGMKMLGYHPLYVLGRCIKAKWQGVRMLAEYLQNAPIYDKDMAKWLQKDQIRNILKRIYEKSYPWT